MAYGVQLEAQYQDGFTHTETEADQSLYKEGANVFHDILHKLPEADHGRMTRFTAHTKSKRFDIDWQTLPDNARPIYLRDMQLTRDVASGNTTVEALKHRFGYQYTDQDGRNHKEVIEI